MENHLPTLDDLRAFLKTQQLCVVSTLAADGRPMGAMVAFSEDDQLHLMIGTSVRSRKYANLSHDPRIAVTVSDPAQRLTMQYEGRVRQLEGEELARRQEAHYAKLPGSLPFKDLPDQAFFTIEPVHIQFSDVGQKPWTVAKFDF
jgi:nitroimidazol reductase NimA-like FMN-containing flavoprotein (pyridoxamine 5'-phosphate oxidase superfamily)